MPRKSLYKRGTYDRLQQRQPMPEGRWVPLLPFSHMSGCLLSRERGIKSRIFSHTAEGAGGRHPRREGGPDRAKAEPERRGSQHPAARSGKFTKYALI